jgi:RNA 2',3'-cyclic 3'-phosphodiesterase
MHRLFVGLRPPATIRAGLTASMGGVAGARWQSDDQLHLTLRFIGEVERPVAEDIATVLTGVRAPAPMVAIAGVGRFDTALWAAVAPHDALAALHRKVDQAIVRVGLPPERRAYLPHVTLARLSRTAGASPEVARWCADHAGLASPAFALTHMILFESRLGHEGASYEPVERYPFG